MVAAQFIDYLSKFQVGTYVGVEDFADKFNFLFTVILLLLCTAVVTVKQYVLKPISCYLSIDIGGFNLLEYTENYCWVEGTVPISYGGKIPTTDAEWRELNDIKILYYQWVPFMLGLQGLMFHIPRLVWQLFCYNYTGTDLTHLVSSANQAVHSSEEAKQKMVLHIARTLEQVFYQHRDNRSGHLARVRRRLHSVCSFFVISKRQGTRLFAAYFMVKILYMANCVSQLLMLQVFLSNVPPGPHSSGMGGVSWLFGLSVWRNISLGHDWRATLMFPRVGYCYVPIKVMGAVNQVVAQCVLPVNMLNEKIFFFLWCWILTSFLVTLISLLLWCGRMTYFRRQRGFIHRYLKLNQQIRNSRDENCMIAKFESQFLRHDGVFLLRMIGINAGDMIASDVVCQLWKIFKVHYANRNFLNDGSDAAEDNDDRTLIKLESNGFKHQTVTSPATQNSDINRARSPPPSAPVLNHKVDLLTP